MKIVNLVLCISALLVMISPESTSAQDEREIVSLMVSRDADGSINKQSKKAVRTLSKLAKKAGHVRVWVTLDTPFDPFLVQTSEQQAADQQIRLDQLFDEVLAPLLNDGYVQYPDGERTYMNASVSLEVTEKGLSRLVRDERVGQIVGVPEKSES